MNKAGYTAISCGRVGRGGYARFPTFQLVLTRDVEAVDFSAASTASASASASIL